jgi:hypothetical protein
MTPSPRRSDPSNEADALLVRAMASAALVAVADDRGRRVIVPGAKRESQVVHVVPDLS